MSEETSMTQITTNRTARTLTNNESSHTGTQSIRGIFSTAIMIAATFGTLLTGASASAEGYGYKDKHDDRRYVVKHRYDRKYRDHGYDDRHYYDERDYKHKRKHARSEKLRLDIPVRLRGNDRLRIGRALNRHYNIDLDHYNIRKVVFKNRSRNATATLRVGHYVTEPVYLDRGRNEIYAPSEGKRWILNTNGARIHNVRVVLEPKHRYAYARKDYKKRDYYSKHQHKRAYYDRKRRYSW